MKRELNGLKSDMILVKGDLRDLKDVTRSIAKSVARLTGEFSDLKQNMATKGDMSIIMKRMDGFADMLQDSRWDWGKQKVRLDDHEKRISSLEAKRA